MMAMNILAGSLATLHPTNLRINRTSRPIGSRAVAVTWDLQCESSCLGERQEAFRVKIFSQDDGIMLDSGRQVGQTTSHADVVTSLRSARRYTLEVSVWSGEQGKASASTTVHTAMLDEPWQGEWIGGFTQLRGDFTLAQPPSSMVSALAHASGVGCFALTVNGAAADAADANRSYMNPGWANVPTVRMLYQQFDISSLLRKGPNVLGVRLGQCKYGYQGAFCSGAHGSTAA